jgi:16S rRNA processing protein RimM
VLASRPHQGVWLVLFDGVPDRTAAEGLRGVVLRAEAIDDTEADFVHELIGARLVTIDGADHGEVVAVEANPAADLLVLADGRLVPMTFVTEVVAGERVVVDPPAGLLSDD